MVVAAVPALLVLAVGGNGAVVGLAGARSGSTTTHRNGGLARNEG